MRPVLVLGASGFLGRWVARLLAERGQEPVLAVRDPAAVDALRTPYGLRGDVAPVDLAAPGAAAGLVRAVRPALVLDLAGYGVDPAERDERAAQRMNAELVAELAEACAALETPPRLVHAGSALEFGEVRHDLSDPWDCDPTTPYGRTKLAGSRALADVAARTGLRACTARLFTVYGPGEHRGRLLPTLLEAARNGGEVPLSAGAQRRDFTYVEDAAEGLLRLAWADVPPGATVNLATGVLTPVRLFAEVAADELGVARARLRFGALPVRAGEMEHAPVSLAALERLLGWRPRTGVRAGVARTRDFARARGLL